MGFKKITEQPSRYRHLESMPVKELLENMNREDSLIAEAVKKAVPQIEALTDCVADKMWSGGRLFYVGAGTSGRLGILDASECPTTFGVPEGLVTGIIAGGEKAMRSPVEHAEDDKEAGWQDLLKHSISAKDFVIGIAASGTTPYVLGALEKCRYNRVTTGCITNNPGSPLVQLSDFPVEVEVGPEFITGSTRMKSGTSQKLVLNMISTAIMIQLGRVEDNKMVNMQLTNAKLVDRGTRIVMEKTGEDDYEKAKKWLVKYGSVKKAIENFSK